MPQNATPRVDLTPQQALAVEQLVLGATVVNAATAAGVSRETVHRWSREDWAFQAAVNRARHELQDAMERRLLALADRAMANVAEAVESGNLKASLTVLKGLGVLSGVQPGLCSDDPALLAEEAELRALADKSNRRLRRLTASL